MIRFLLYLAFLSPLIYASLWLADHPGEITLDWIGYRIETSLAVILAIFLLVTFFITGVTLILRILFVLPKNMSSQWKYSKQSGGIESLTLAMSALAIADYKMAEKHLSKAQKLLGADAAPTLILKAQIAAATGNNDKSHASLEAMLEHKETRQIGLRGLLTQSIKSKEDAKALHYAKEAFDAQPSDRFVALSLLSILLAQKAWDEAEKTIHKASSHRAISGSERKRYLAILAFSKAQDYATQQNYEQALAALDSAEKADKNFAPIATLRLRILRKTNDRDAYFLALKRYWRRAPSAAYLEDMLQLFAAEKEVILTKKLRQIAALSPEQPESLMAAARAEMLQGHWPEAKALLQKALSLKESATIFEWLSDIEKSESGNLDAAASWLKQAIHAPTTAFWQCSQCNHIAPEWQLHCTHCHAFDASTWVEPEITTLPNNAASSA